ncbi:hypothetical protein Tco_1147693, partial [Tanacetum coccineum]
MDLDALIALANAAVTVDSNIPPGCASNTPAASSYIPTDVPTGGVISTDISEITRKQSKTSKHGHENQKSTKRSQRIKAEARKVKPQSNPLPIIEDINGQDLLERAEAEKT